MQTAIVAVIVLYAAWVVVKRYAPQALRRAVGNRLAALGRRLGWSWLERKCSAAATAPTSACGACGACGGCARGKMAPPSAKSLKRTPR